MWLHLQSSQKRVKDYCDFVDIEYKKRISYSVTRWLSLYPSLPTMFPMYPASYSYLMSIDKTTVVQKPFFRKIPERPLFTTLRYFQSFLVALNEQVRNSEKSKASFVEFVSCFTTVKASIP